MKRTKHLSIASTAAIVAVFAIGALAADPGAAQRARKSTASAPAGGATVRTATNDAPQVELDAALYVTEPFFDVSARIARPYAEARPLVAALAPKYPADARVPLHLARLDERLGAFDVAAKEMEAYATLANRAPNALRRLAAFYRGRAAAGDEIRVLQELADRLPPTERAPVLRRAIAAWNDGRPSIAVEPLYDRLIDADPSDGASLRDYVSLLLASNDSGRAFAALDRAAKADPNPSRELSRTLLLERARIYDSLGQRKQAVDVYERVFDPLWSRAVAADYYGLLSRYGLYGERRRDLQKQAAAPSASFATVARLFNFYAYEGNLPAAQRLLATVETSRKGAAWPASELELAANLYIQVNDLDQASRYLYSLYLQNALSPSSPDRERILSRLFTALVSSRGGATRLAPGGISLYADIARVDPHPGALNALLSLILAGNRPAAEFATEDARAGGYFNAALANTIYEQFRKEYPASPHLGEMTSDLVSTLASLGADKDLVTVGSEFLAKFPASPAWSEVAIKVADAQVRLKNRTGERAVLQALLDHAAAAQPANKPLLERNASRWIYQPEPTPEDPDASEDQPDDVFVAPNGKTVPSGQASRFTEGGGDDEYSGDDSSADSYEPTAADAPSDVALGERDPGLTDYDGHDVDSDDLARPTYAGLLERMIASYEADDKRPAALGFFWGEVKKHPKDEGLMERFLGWLGGTSLFDEQLKAYRAALDRYDDDTWLHRFARWHIKAKRGTELKRLLDEVVRNMDDDDAVAQFVEEFGGYTYAPGKNDFSYNNAFALAIERVAHARFPNNARIVKLMLANLDDNATRAEWERLSREYYFADPDIRSAYLTRLSKDGKLDAALAEARAKMAGGLESGPSTAFANAVFAADAARWLSHFDDSVAAYRKLAELYPGERAYAEPLADLTRSLGSRDVKLYAESANVLDRMATIYPTDHRYATRAGEALAEAGDMGEAAKRWRTLVASAPGSPSTRLEVATVFWDYYQFDDAVAQLLAIRTQTHDDSLYAFRLGAVYDSKRDLARAIPEYVKTLGDDAGERDSARQRLAVLSRRDGVPAQIDAAYAAARSAHPDDWHLALGYADYLRWVGKSGEAVGVLNREVAASHDLAFLAEARDRFRQWTSAESEERVLRKVVDEARDERERIRSRLELATFLDEQGHKDDAAGVYDKLVADNPTNVGVLEEATRYYWRAGKLDRSVDLSRTVIGKAQGAYKKSFVLALARRQSEANRLGDAEATLRTYFDQNALDMEVFGALAKVLGDAKKETELTELYTTALKRVREAGLDDYEEDAQIAALRTGTIASLTALGRFQDAVDQHIELINEDAENLDTLDAAFDYAARHDLTPRLVGYYQKLAKDSYKDYRWGVVLGRLLDRTGDVAGAADAYRSAVSNEPQRVDIRRDFAEALVRAGREDDAVAELRRGWEIDGREPEWLVSVAAIRVRQGRLDDAAAAVDEALAARPNLPPWRVFGYARKLADWGLLDRSVAIAERAIDAAKAAPKDANISTENIVSYVSVAARVRPIPAVFARLESDRSAFLAIAAKPGNFDSGSAKSVADAIEGVEKSSFAGVVVDYSTGEERAALDSALRSAAASASDDDARIYLAIAEGAGLQGAEETLQIRLVDSALGTSATDKGASFHSRLGELVDMYSGHRQYDRAADQLAAYRSKDTNTTTFEYDRRTAEMYRLSGEPAKEIEALTRLYSTASGEAVDRGSAAGADAAKRLFELLVATNQRDRLVALATTQSPYQFALINFLIDHNDQDLARRAVAAANVSPVWVRAQTAEIGLYFRDASPEVESAFRDAIRARPIGELVTTPFDAKTMLTGSDYFLLARNYGVWLDLVANRPEAARDYLLGRVEERPRDGAAQAQLARYYVARANTTAALAHIDLAEELSPSDNTVIAIRGEVLLAAGRRDDAIAEWTKLLRKEDAGGSEYTLYFNELAGNNLLDRALTDLRDVVANRIYAGEYAEVSPLVTAMTDFADANPTAWPAVADAIYGVAVQSTDDVLLLRQALSEEKIPEDRRGPFYRLLTDRLASIVAAAKRNPDASNGMYVGDDYIYPAEELWKWRRRTADFLVRRNEAGEAAKLLDALEAERIEASGTLRSDTTEEDYSWIELARATIALRSGRTAEAVAALGRYVEPWSADNTPSSPDSARYVEAVAVLRANKADGEADTLLESLYRRLLDERKFDTANFTGLAEVLYRRGRNDEADATLRRLVARDPDDASRYSAAAAAATTAGRYPLAIELREGVAKLARADVYNALELARLRAASGDAAGGVLGYAAVADDDRAANSLRAQAVDLGSELIAKDSAARAAYAPRAGAAKTDGGKSLAALAAASAGDVDGARRTLEPLASTGSAIAALELGRLELAANRPAQAVNAFERALGADPDAAIASAVAFGGSTPREALVRLYAGMDRGETALALASGPKSTISAGGDGDDSEETDDFLFEPASVEVVAPNAIGSLDVRNSEAHAAERAVTFAALADAAAKLGRLDEAVAYARGRVASGNDADKQKAEARLKELIAAQQDAARHAESTWRVGQSVAYETIQVRDFRFE